MVALLRLIIMSFLALRLLGGDVAMLQVVAWTGMIISRTADRGIAAAVESTLDGDEPCPLCEAVKAVQQSEREPQPSNPENLIAKLKLKEMIQSKDMDIPSPAGDPKQTRVLTEYLASLPKARTDAPDVPPPKSRAA